MTFKPFQLFSTLLAHYLSALFSSFDYSSPTISSSLWFLSFSSSFLFKFYFSENLFLVDELPSAKVVFEAPSNSDDVRMPFELQHLNRDSCRHEEICAKVADIVDPNISLHNNNETHCCALTESFGYYIFD